MIYGNHILALATAWAQGDPARFHSIALQAAAIFARAGDPKLAQSIRDVIDNAYRNKTYLVPFSGVNVVCAKCNTAGASIKYTREPDLSLDAMTGKGSNTIEFLERQCGRCEYTWYERCADARPAQRDYPPLAG